MKAEIYGVDESDFRCGGCIAAKRLFSEAGIEFEFHKVVTRGEDTTFMPAKTSGSCFFRLDTNSKETPSLSLVNLFPLIEGVTL